LPLKDFNVAGMVRTGLWCERNLGVEVLSIGRPAENALREDCVMEISGRSLFVRIGLRGGWIWVAACGMDEGGGPEPLFNIGDGAEGWVVVRRFLMALERSAIKSLQPRPIHIGADSGPDAWTIA
jgi:hypothetical protein